MNGLKRLLIAGLLLAVACKEAALTPTAPPPPEQDVAWDPNVLQEDSLPSSPVTGPRLVRQDWHNDDATNRQSYLYTYNKAGLLAKVTRINRGEGSESTSYHLYRYDPSGRVSKSRQIEGEMQWENRYQYNAGNLLEKVGVYYWNNLQKYTLFEYNSSRQLVKATEYKVTDPNSTGQATYRHAYSYHPTGNLASWTQYTLWDNSQAIQKAVYDSFDDKANFASLLRGLPFSRDNANFTVSSYCSECPNNYRVMYFYSDCTGDDPSDPYVRSECKYAYTPEGFPASMQSQGWTLTFQYEQ